MSSTRHTSNSQQRSRPEASNISSRIQNSGAEKLDLSMTGLRELPPQALNFLNAKEINLSSNQLSTLSPSIKSFMQLRSLELAWNQLLRLPPEIGQLRNLEILKMPFNKVTTFPHEIGRCFKLKTLEANDNQIEALPDSLGNCIHLSTLNLEYNRLDNLPASLSRLRSLTVARFSGNPLTGIPDEVQLAGISAIRTYLGGASGGSEQTISQTEEKSSSENRQRSRSDEASDAQGSTQNRSGARPATARLATENELKAGPSEVDIDRLLTNFQALGPGKRTWKCHLCGYLSPQTTVQCELCEATRRDLTGYEPPQASTAEATVWPNLPSDALLSQSADAVSVDVTNSAAGEANNWVGELARRREVLASMQVATITDVLGLPSPRLPSESESLTTSPALQTGAVGFDSRHPHRWKSSVLPEREGNQKKKKQQSQGLRSSSAGDKQSQAKPARRFRPPPSRVVMDNDDFELDEDSRIVQELLSKRGSNISVSALNDARMASLNETERLYQEATREAQAKRQQVNERRSSGAAKGKKRTRPSQRSQQKESGSLYARERKWGANRPSKPAASKEHVEASVEGGGPSNLAKLGSELMDLRLTPGHGAIRAALDQGREDAYDQVYEQTLEPTVREIKAQPKPWSTKAAQPKKVDKNPESEPKPEDESVKKECAICMDAPKDTLIAPCGHVCCCNSCAVILKARGDSCPVCRGSIENTFKVFHA